MKSLRRPLENQITTVSEMMSHCKKKLSTISICQLLKEDLDELRTSFSDRLRKHPQTKEPRISLFWATCFAQTGHEKD